MVSAIYCSIKAHRVMRTLNRWIDKTQRHMLKPEYEWKMIHRHGNERCREACYNREKKNSTGSSFMLSILLISYNTAVGIRVGLRMEGDGLPNGRLMLIFPVTTGVQWRPHSTL